MGVDDSREVLGIALERLDAVVNAMAYRDYAIYGANIRPRLFADRFKLYSPGMIPCTMTVDSLPYRQAARPPEMRK